MAAHTTNNSNINNKDACVQLAGSILKDEYDRINRKINHLQEAHLVALRTLYPLPRDPAPISEVNSISKNSTNEYVRSPALQVVQWSYYEVASIWLNCQKDVEVYCRHLDKAIKDLEAQRTDIIKGLLSRTAC